VRGAAGEIASDLGRNGSEASDDGTGHCDKPEDQRALNAVDLFSHSVYLPAYAADLSAYAVYLSAYAADLSAYAVYLSAYAADLSAYAVYFPAYAADLFTQQLEFVLHLLPQAMHLGFHAIESMVNLVEALVDVFEAQIDPFAHRIEPSLCPFLRHCLHDARLAWNVLSVVELGLEKRHGLRTKLRH